jgi:MraZ protein
MDEKRRVPVPFRWKPEESEGVEFTLVVWPQHQAGVCIRVLSPEQLTTLRASINAMPNGNEKTVLKRRIGTMSAQAKLDNAGRITIPDNMVEAAGLSGEVVLAGLIDKFEIWSSKRYADVERLDSALMGKAFEMLE